MFRLAIAFRNFAEGGFGGVCRVVSAGPFAWGCFFCFVFGVFHNITFFHMKIKYKK